MIKWYLIMFVVFVFGMIVGASLVRDYIFKNDANGLCIRADDGEVYLRLSEHAQHQLADPKTEMLILRVTNTPTRNKQSI